MRELIRREFTVYAPLLRAWDHLADIEAWPRWARHIERVELHPPGPLTAATTGRFHLRTGLKPAFSMVELVAPEHWMWSGKVGPLTVEYDHRLEAVSTGQTKIRFIVSAKGFGVWLFGPLFAAVYGRDLDRAIENLVREIGGPAT